MDKVNNVRIYERSTFFKSEKKSNVNFRVCKKQINSTGIIDTFHIKEIELKFLKEHQDKFNKDYESQLNEFKSIDERKKGTIINKKLLE